MSSGLVTWRSRHEAVLRATWWLPLLLMVASDYKLRRRASDQAISGSADPFIVIELGIYLAVGCYLLVRLRPTMRHHIVLVWMAGYLLAAAASTLYAPFPVFALVRGVQLVVILLALLQFVQDADLAVMRRLLHGYVVLVTASIGIGLAYVAPQTGEQLGRFTWLYTHSVVAGAMLAASVVILFGMWLTHRTAGLPWVRWAYGLLLVVHIVALLQTRTRGSIGSAMVAMVVVTLLWLDAKGARDLFIAASVFVTLVVLTVAQPILAYLLRNSDFEQLASLNRRTDLWAMAIEMFAERPLIGFGFTSTRGLFLERTSLGGAHNAFVNVLVDLGLIGMLWWGGLVVLIIVHVGRLRRRVRTERGLEALAFDALTVTGLMVCMLINALTAEYLAGGVGAAAMLLYLVGAWVVLAGDAADSVTTERRRFPRATRVSSDAWIGAGSSPEASG
jgi:exopolysaccharide production protein ExoQ